MKSKSTITTLTLLIAVLSAVASITGIFSNNGPGRYEHETIRGTMVEIYGKGLYKHMSADVAVQGIAQDIVTLLIGTPLMLAALRGYVMNSVKSRFLLAGVTGYFFVTNLFYMAMGMYNEMFLVYVTLLGMSFFALYYQLAEFNRENLTSWFSSKTPIRFAGGFLMFNAAAIGLMWLGRIVPPLLDGSVYPNELHHYTTLIVQGFDLGLLLPVAFISGWLLIKRTQMGFLTGIPYLVFLSILMTALTAKLIAMGINGVEIFPAVVIIPVFNLATILCASLMLKNIQL